MTFFPQISRMPSKYFKLILGPISSGKTTELSRLASRYKSIGKTIISFHASPEKDDIIAKNQNFEFMESSTAVNELLPHLKDKSIWEANIIIIDAIHLLEDSYDFITQLISRPDHNIAIIAAGCDSNIGRQSNENIEKLISFADDVEKFKGICPFHSGRTIGGDMVHSLFNKYMVDRDTDGEIHTVCRSHALYDVSYLEKNPPEKEGRLELIMGPMFSGKTTEAMRRVNLYKQQGKKVMAINHEINRRYGSNVIHSHDKKEIENCYSLSDLYYLYDYLRKEFDEADVIFIEETQFFSQAYDFIRNIVDIDGKIVIVAGLDGNYKREPFGDMNKLVSIADDVVKLHALCTVCRDGTLAPFTMRVNKSDISTISVGGMGDYEGVCRNCFDKNWTATLHQDAMDLLKEQLDSQ